MTRVASVQAAVPATEEATAADFRRRLVDGLVVAIRERGFRDSTVADIVRHARTSRRTFYEHFSDKQDCFIALLRDSNQQMIAEIAAAVDRHAPWREQVRQAVEAWIAVSRSEPAVTLAWIREVPSLGENARQLARETMEGFVALITALTDNPDLRAEGIHPAPRRLVIMLVGGLRELIATTVEDGGDIRDIVPVAVEATTVLLGPR